MSCKPPTVPHARKTSIAIPTHAPLARQVLVYFGGLCVGALPGPGAVVDVGAGSDAVPGASPDGAGPDASPDGPGAGPEVNSDGIDPGPDGVDPGPDGPGPGPDERPDGAGVGPDGKGPGPDVCIGVDVSPDGADPGPGLVGSTTATPVAVCVAPDIVGSGVEDDDGGTAGAGSLPEVSIGAGPVLSTTFDCSFSLMGICRPRDAP